MSEPQYTVPEIIRLCGGAEAIAERSSVTKWAVYKWPKIGIPDDHWGVIMSMSGVSVQQLHEATQAARFSNVSEAAA